MSLIALVVVLVVVGIGLYWVKSSPIIEGNMKAIITWVVIGVVLLWIIVSLLGHGQVHDIRI